MGSPRSRSVQGSTTDLVRWSTHALSLIDDCRFAEEERVFSKRFEEESTALVQSETIARLEQEVAMLNQQLVEVSSVVTSRCAEAEIVFRSQRVALKTG